MKQNQQIELIERLLKQSQINRSSIAKNNAKKPQVKTIRNPEFNLLNDQVKAANLKENNDVKESLKYKDFSQTTKSNTAKSAQLEQYIRAVLLLKQGFSEVEKHVSQYDPNIDLVENTLEKAEDYIKQLNKRFTELLNIRPKVNNLTENEEREFNAISREIERYSVDLSEMKTSIEKLNGKQRLNPDELADAHRIMNAKKSRNQIQDDTKNIFQYGPTHTKIEIENIKRDFEDPEKKKIIKEVVNEELKKFTDNLNELKKNYTSLSERSERILLNEEYRNVKKVADGKKLVDDMIRNSNELQVKVHKFLSKIKRVNIDNFEDFIKATKLNEVIDDLNRKTVEKIEEIDKYVEDFHHKHIHKTDVEIKSLTYLLDFVEKLLVEIDDTKLKALDLRTFFLTQKRGKRITGHRNGNPKIGDLIAYASKYIKGVTQKASIYTIISRGITEAGYLIEDLNIKTLYIQKRLESINTELKSGEGGFVVVDKLRFLLAYENNEDKVNLKRTTQSWEELINTKIENEMDTPSRAFYTFAKESTRLEKKKIIRKDIKLVAKKYYDIEQLRTQPFRYLQLQVLVDLQTFQLLLNEHIEDLRAEEDNIKAEIDDYKEKRRQQEEADRLVREEQQRLHDEEQKRIDAMMMRGLEDEEGDENDLEQLIIPIPAELPEVILAPEPEPDPDQEDADLEMDLSQSEEAESEEAELEEAESEEAESEEVSDEYI